MREPEGQRVAHHRVCEAKRVPDGQNAHWRGPAVVLRQAREPLHSRERQPWVFRRPALAAAIKDLNDRRRVECVWKALGRLVAVSYEGGHISPVESRRADPSVVEGDHVAPLPVFERVVLPERQVLGVAQVEAIAIERALATIDVPVW